MRSSSPNSVLSVGNRERSDMVAAERSAVRQLVCCHYYERRRDGTVGRLDKKAESRVKKVK